MSRADLNQSMRLRDLLAFALPAIPHGIVLFPAMGILPTFYAKHTGLSLTTIGSVMLAAKIFDAVSDPVIGYLTDNTHTAIGRRKPWIIAGGFLCAVCVFFLFTPSSNSSSLYFAFWFISLFFAFTVLDIPHRAWGMEISRDYEERTRVASLLAVCGVIGMLLFAATPLLAYPPFNLFPSTDFGPEMLKFEAILVVLLLIIGVSAAVTWGPPSQTLPRTQTDAVFRILAAFSNNTPFWRFIGIYVLAGLGNGMHLALSFLYMDTYLGIGDKVFLILIVDSLLSMIAMPFWQWAAITWGKHRAWAVGSLGTVLPMALIWALEPGPNTFMLILPLAVARGLMVASSYALPTAVLGDVVDYDSLKSNQVRGGNYFAAYGLMAKINAAVGSGLGFLILGLVDYQVSAENSELAILGLKTSVVLIPCLLLSLSSMLAWTFPLDQRRQTIIATRLHQRSTRAGNKY